ncbi:MAG: YfcE family phosphodiesterase [Roseburia sp.]|nr:YfcE family phosphodiesterase [Roseburia sp.]
MPHLKDCDYLIHAGDVNTRACYDKIKELGIPMYVVRGNSDMGFWADFLPEFLSVPIGGKIFYIVHDRYDLPYDLSEADFIIFGHTHCYETFERGGKVYINPGSAGQPRWDARSLAILELPDEDGAYSVGTSNNANPIHEKAYELTRILL